MSCTKDQLYGNSRVVVKKNTSTEDMCNKDMCNNTEEKHRKYRKLGKYNQ